MPRSLALQLVKLSSGSHFGQHVPIATQWPIGQVTPYPRMCGNWHGLTKNAAKTDLSWRGCCAMVRVAAACFVVVVCLSYNTQVVKYNAPTTLQPCETFPQFILMIKWYPVLGEHSRIISSLWRLFRSGEQLREMKTGFQFWGEISGVSGTLVHTTLLDS